ncbi:MAG: MFS transporter [Chloroflexota bacterium]|nr:MFS transporter [Chloroflexota bacterium]MDP6757499.1 MFS transporter [Chloroflexota bacterium]
MTDTAAAPAEPEDDAPAGEPTASTGGSDADATGEPLPEGNNWLSRPLLRLFPTLSVRDYRIVWEGNVATSLSYWMQQTVEGWLIYELTGSPLFLGVIALARTAPLILFSPFGGVIADRVDRTRLIMYSQLIAGVVAIAVALLLILKLLEPWHLLITAVIAGTMTSINIPARQALIASLVGRQLIMNAVALHSFALNTSRIIGPQIAGLLLSLIGPFACYIGQGGAYFWASQNLRRIRVRPTIAPTGASGFVANMVEGVRYAFTHPQLRGVFLAGAVSTTLLIPYVQFLPAFVKDVYESGPGGLAILMGAAGAGGLLGSLVTAAMGNMHRKGYLLFAGSFLAAAGTIGLALSSSLVLSVAILVLAGIGSGISMLTVGALMQLIAADEYRGRVGSLQIILWGLSAVGGLPMGFFAERSSVPLVVGIAGALAFGLLLLLLVAQPKIRQIE